MLTKNDLQAIRTIVEDVVDGKLKPIKRDISKIKKTTDTLIDHFDRREVTLQKRVTRLERFLHLPREQ
jgi:hypothetical protein